MGVALPTFVTGPNPVPATIQRDVIFSNTTLNSSVTASGSFDITVLESRDFYSALLSPVDLPTLNYFLRQGYSRELLFWLFTDSVRETVGNTTFEYRNEPGLSENRCPAVAGQPRCFNKMVDVAIGAGLTVETRIERGGSRAAKKGAEAPRNVVHGRLCFDPVLATRAKAEYAPDLYDWRQSPAGHQPQCRKWHPDHKERGQGDTDVLTFQLVGTPVGAVKYEIITRSTFGIYQFLGNILARGLTNEVRMRLPLDNQEDPRILNVTRERDDGCFTEIITTARPIACQIVR